MGTRTYSREAYEGARRSFTEEGKSGTARGEQHVRETGKLNPLVDPAEFGVVRESRIRLEPRTGGGFEVSVGTPSSLEYRLDTTGSMGDNVERAIKALPQTCELTSALLPERDPFYCASIFGDVVDRFVLCRGQFEVLADRMVNQLTLMHPEAQGGDGPEDPHYGLFGAAYLTNAYLHRIGLRSFDFTITDATAHDRLSPDQLERIFGSSVFEKARENGHEIDPKDLPTNQELVADVLHRAHAFVLLVGTDARKYWTLLYSKERVAILPTIEYVPHVMAVITGLTEGTLDLLSAVDFLTGVNLQKSDARQLVDSVAHIPIGGQCALPNFGRMPKKGDVFMEKTDLWPVNPEDLPTGSAGEESPAKPDGSGGWL